MTKKKGFILYADILESVDYLSDEDLGRFFRAILYFQNGKDFDISPNLKIGFEFLKAQFARDSAKYSSEIEKRSLAGIKSGEARRLKSEQNEQERTKRTHVQIVEQNERKATNRADKETDKETDKEKSLILMDHFEVFWENYVPVKTKDGFVKKGSKEKAQIAFQKVLRKTTIERINSALQSYLTYCNQNQRFTKQAASWLNDGDFELIENQALIVQQTSRDVLKEFANG